MIDTERMSCQRLIAAVMYPPIVLQPTDLTHLYAEISARYPYQTYQQLPDGARMANPEGDIFVQTARSQVNESVRYFQASKEKVVDIFEMIQERFNMQQFMNLGVKLLAFLPLDEAPAAADFIEERILPGIEDNLDILGEGRQGTGIRVRLQREAIHDLRIEPFFNDLSQLYIELDVQHPFPFSDISSIEPRIEAAYSYIFNEVKSFLASFND